MPLHVHRLFQPVTYNLRPHCPAAIDAAEKAKDKLGDKIEVESVKIDDSTHPEYTASNDYSKIYYIKGRTLYECSTKTGTEKELRTDLKFAEAYPTGISSDGRYLKLYMYTRKVGYYQLHLFDLETNELYYPEEYSNDYFYSISPDMTEVLVSTTNIPLARLYEAGENIEDFILLLNRGEDLPEEQPIPSNQKDRKEQSESGRDHREQQTH